MIIKYENKESVLNHVYMPNPFQIRNLEGIKPYLGDHSMIILDSDLVKPEAVSTIRRNWQNYTRINLYNMLIYQHWVLHSDSVQDCWNKFESNLNRAINGKAPLTALSNNAGVKTTKLTWNPHIYNTLAKSSKS
jgi:hypothetical protein